jgi:hypothetical protein
MKQRLSMNSATRVTLVFCLAGLLSGVTYVAYSTWVDTLYSAVPSQYAAPHRSPAEAVAAYENWYRAHTALTKYADRKWPILCLGFPVAMTLASLLALEAGWLPHTDIRKLFPGLLPVYFAPVLVLFLSAVSWFLLLIPSLAFAAYLLTLSVKVITSRKQPGLFLRFLFSGALCLVIWFVFLVLLSGDKSSGDVAGNLFLLALEVMWGGIFGMGLLVLGGAAGLVA